MSTPVTEDIVLPFAKADDETLRQAILHEKGDVVYQILSRTQKSGQLHLRVLTMPRAEWEKFSSLPREAWPLVPEAYTHAQTAVVKKHAQKILLSVAAIIISLSIVYQILQIFSLSSYQTSLHAMSKAGVAAVKPVGSLPQETWVRELNAVTQALAQSGGKLLSFEFSGKKAQVKLAYSGDASALLERALGKTIEQTQEGVWLWQD